MLAGLLVLTVWLAPAAHADVNDFVINRFSADYTLTNADKQGEMKVVETIDVTFHDYNHGILRAIPNSYKHHSLQLQVNELKVDNQAGQYTTYGSNGNTVLKIGDPGKTITGQHHYVITYTLRNVITFYADHDELYWDVNGDQWQQTAEQVQAIVHLPKTGLAQTRTPVCYTGVYGSTQQDCGLAEDGPEPGFVMFSHRPLQANETMSIVAGFKKGYFQLPTWYETAGEYTAGAVKFLIPLLLLAGTAGIQWFRYGRDPKGRRVTIPEYDAPDDLRPIEVGTVADFRTDNRDISATIIDLAIRGYIKIIETTEERKLRKDVKKYSLRLLKDNFEELNEFETMLIKALFLDRLVTNEPVGGEVSLDDLKYKLSSTSVALKNAVKRSLTNRGYFHKTPLSATLKFCAVVAVEILAIVIAGAILQSSAFVWGAVVGGGLLIVFLVLMPSRTALGVAAKEKILGLKLYLEVAEAERIKKLQSPDAPYAPKSNEPKKTVELFEKLLPYAMVLGVEQQWAKKFEDIYRTPPDWYQGNWSTFSALYLVSSLNSGVQAGVNTAFSAPSSSSSSGFGGGFSGGGGGGGGGGGW